MTFRRAPPPSGGQREGANPNTLNDGEVLPISQDAFLRITQDLLQGSDGTMAPEDWGLIVRCLKVL